MISAVDSPDSPTRVQTNLRHELFRLVLPVLAEQFLIFGIGFFDTLLSGQLGTQETSAIGLAAYVSWLGSTIFCLVSTGASAIVARHWGAGEFAEARRITARSLTLSLFVGMLVFVLLRELSNPFAMLMKMEGEQHRIAVEYLRFDAWSQCFAAFTQIAAASLRGAGDMRTPLCVLGMTNCVNIVVSSVCTWGWGPFPEMGVTGIVIGTVFAQACGAVLMAYLLFSGRGRIHVRFCDFGFDTTTARRIMRVGGPAALAGITKVSGHFAFLMVISRLSSRGFDGATFAAHFVGIRIEALSYLPAEAFGIAAAALVGQSLGAGQTNRALEVGREAVRQCIVYAALMTLGFLVFAPQIYALMHRSPEVAASGIPAFRLMALYQVPNTILIIYSCCLIGAGDTLFPLYCSLIGNVIVRVGLGYLCGVHWNGGLTGAWIGMGADNILRSILIAQRYRSGQWVYTKI
ncbi:MAG: MATE family efflux transporter [Planctomycetales bacterium]|nr:MATE family efflux transporter [Planctomycetales bacterium]